MKSGSLKIVAFIVLALSLYVLWFIPKPAEKPIGQSTVVTTFDGAKIAYYESGPTNGPRVLLLASLGRSVSDYNLLVPALNDAGYRTIAVDLRGVGFSKLAPDQKPLDLFELANDIQLALDHSGGAGSLAIIGHAFGNRLARAYAAKSSEEINAIILIASGGAQKLESGQKVTKALLNSFNWKLPPPKRNAEIRYAFFAEGNEMPSNWKKGWYQKAAKIQIGAVRKTAISKWRIGGGDAPILVLQGSKDRIAPAAQTSELLKNDFPNLVQVKLVENAGHALLPEQPIFIQQEILAFLDTILNTE